MTLAPVDPRLLGELLDDDETSDDPREALADAMRLWIELDNPRDTLEM